MKIDIHNRQNIEQLVDAFYEKVKVDDVIGYLFNDVAKVNWDVHKPKLYDFWEQIVFQSTTYSGNPMQAHMLLHHHSPLNETHFQRWLKLFFETVDELFDGPTAEFTKQRASAIASVMQAKLFSTEFN
jgi:hemoglobin